MAYANGSWQIAKGVFDRLARDGVERTIKDRYWTKQINHPSGFRAIWKYRAQAGCQMPYAVYTVPSDTMIGQSTGAVKSESIQNRQATIQFMCYAATDGKSDETWAIDVASLIVDAVENGKLTFSENTRFINLIRQGDIELRDDDDNSVFVVSWQVDYELIVALDRLLA